ncbi:hypothetical protein BK673_16150 [Pseudomonas fluorescens]|uniref:Resolvase/invertase-type recombinase catalytic domain-containing protein n=1 Tax=Pseudomonas fluorescens TaxID=294 RepID=A0A423P4B4_PSEFL|nr:recombinase family protein [Pseudomonas fluorescens]ROO08071.1 hypothetical protein BK673_16150 [Pseudomonas fluorescens]
MPQAVSYIRFSSSRQQGGSSVKRQQQMVDKWLIAHPEYIRSNLIYEDLGRSGYHGEHITEGGNFAKLLTAVKAGLIQAGDCVLVEAIDRTGRLPSLQMLNKVISPIIEAGVNIITLEDNVVYDQSSVEGGHLFLLVAKIQAAYGYSKQLSRRTKASYDLRAEKAHEKQVKRHTPLWLTTEGQVIESIAKHVRHAFELYVSGVGKQTIANRMRATGVEELAKCSGPTVEGWLRNYATIGSWEYGKKDAKLKGKDADNPVKIIPNVYPPIVSDSLFMLAQQRKKVVATKALSRTSKHLLVGLVKCGECGSNYVIHNKDGKPNNMRCGLHHRLGANGCTNNQTIPYQVLNYVYQQTAIHHLQAALNTTQLSANDRRKLELNTERDKLSGSITRLAKMMAVVDDPEVLAEVQTHSLRRKEIDEQLEILDRNPKVVGGHPASVNTMFDLLKIEEQMMTDPQQLNCLYRQGGYNIKVVGKQMVVDGQSFTYIGVKRKPKSTSTLAYRVLHGDKEVLVSPEMSIAVQTVSENMTEGEKINYLHSRGNPLNPIMVEDYEYV